MLKYTNKKDCDICFKKTIKWTLIEHTDDSSKIKYYCSTKCLLLAMKLKRIIKNSL